MNYTVSDIDRLSSLHLLFCNIVTCKQIILQVNLSPVNPNGHPPLDYYFMFQSSFPILFTIFSSEKRESFHSQKYTLIKTTHSWTYTSVFPHMQNIVLSTAKIQLIVKHILDYLFKFEFYWFQPDHIIYCCRCPKEALKADNSITMTTAEMYPSHFSMVTTGLSSSHSFRRNERAHRRVPESLPGSPLGGPSYRSNMQLARLHSAAISHEPYFTNFAQLMRKNAPPAPPQLLKNPGRKDNGPGKVNFPPFSQ